MDWRLQDYLRSFDPANDTSLSEALDELLKAGGSPPWPEDADGCETEFVDADDEDLDDGPVIIPAWAERPHWLESYLAHIGDDELEQEDDE